MTRYWKLIPNKCTCDDDPYSDACDYCLSKQDHPGYYTDDQVIEKINNYKEREK